MKDNKLRVDLEFTFDRNDLDLVVDLNYDNLPQKKRIIKIEEVKIEKRGRKKTIDASTKLF